MTVKNLYPTSRPSLDLNFAATKRLDPRITFSRSSSGAFVDANGIIQSAASNVARFDHNPATGESLGLLVEEARTNNLTYSENLSTWSTADITTIPNSLISPTGFQNALKIIPVISPVNLSNSFHGISSSLASTLGNKTFSVYAKSGEYSALLLRAGNFSSSRTLVKVNLTGNGEVSLVSNNSTFSYVSGFVYPVGNGWYRCGFTFALGGTASYFYNISALSDYATANPAGNGVNGIYIANPQWENGDFPTSYIPTPATFTSRASTATFYDSAGIVQTAASGVARSNAFFPDSNGVMRSAGLLLEAAATNLLQQSAAISTSPWSLLNSASVTANSTVAPDGTTTADTLSGTSTSSYIEQTIPWTASGNWTLSLFMKAGTSSQSKVYLVRSGSQVHGTSINWNAGVPSFTATFGCLVSFQALASGWYRIILQLTSVVHTATNFLNIISDNIAGTGTVIIWGVQAEENSYATSYIPTAASTVTRSADVSSSATVTRSADVVSIAGSNFSSWYNLTAGTFASELRFTNTSQGGVLGMVNTGGSDINEGLVIQASTAQLRITNYLDQGSTNNDIIKNTPPVGLNKIAVAGSTNDDTTGAAFNGLSDGSVNASRTQAFASVAGLKIGERSGQRITGTISRLTYWPTRLSDATLQAITR